MEYKLEKLALPYENTKLPDKSERYTAIVYIYNILYIK